jgi:hypothetical protein
MTDQSIEQEIQVKGKIAPRITPQHIENVIAECHYINAGEAAQAGWPDKSAMDDCSPALNLLTICVLVLRNGFTVTGESACASPENFDAEIGRKIARDNAVQKIWLLEGYLLKQQLHDSSATPTRGQMIEYVKVAIGEGYQPEHEAAISDLGVIELLDDHSLNREYGKCWQWYNMGGGIHETFQQQEKHDHACINCFTDKGPCLGECAVSDENAARHNSFVEAATPLIKWMAENVNPHHTAVVDSTSAELLSSEMAVKTEAHLKD